MVRQEVRKEIPKDTGAEGGNGWGDPATERVPVGEGAPAAAMTRTEPQVGTEQGTLAARSGQKNHRGREPLATGG